MSAEGARAWWAEVEDVRERIEAQRVEHSATDRIRPGTSAPSREARGQRSPSRVARRRRPALHLVALRAPTPAPSAPPAAAAPAYAPLARRPLRVPANPDRIAFWAVMLGVFLMLVCVGTAGAATTLGNRTLKAPMEGRDVRQLQAELRQVGLLEANATAHFGPLTARAVKRFQQTRCLTADGIAGPQTIRAIRAHTPRCTSASGVRSRGRVSGRGLTHTRVVTWYGPGMYGRGTACGQTLTSKLIGLAHKTLPCGTHVRLGYAGHVVEAVVVDRGPYAAGVDYDLTWGAARALGVLAAGRASVRSSH